MSGEAVKVVVRSRPFNSKEIAESRTAIVSMDLDINQVRIRDPSTGGDGSAEDDTVKKFTFDAVYDENSTQRAVYDETGYPLVESVLKGYNGTMFAYGQVGAQCLGEGMGEGRGETSCIDHVHRDCCDVCRGHYGRPRTSS